MCNNCGEHKKNENCKCCGSKPMQGSQKQSQENRSDNQKKSGSSDYNKNLNEDNKRK